MDYFKRCPKCGRYMTPNLESKFGYVFTFWTCACGYSEYGGNTRTNNKTTYMGGATNDRTVD